jgi:hypothetical protein
MATSILKSKDNNEFSSFNGRKYAPTLKTEDNSIYNPISKDNLSFLSSINFLDIEKSKLNKMSFLFPSIPKDVIENILKKNKNISIEEGIEQLKDLTLSEKAKKESEKKKPSQIDPNDIKVFSHNRRFKKNFIQKRNYLSIINQKKNFLENTNNNNDNDTINIINNNNNNPILENSNITNNNINTNNIIEKTQSQQMTVDENQIKNNKTQNEISEKEDERVKERKKMELKTVDVVATELLQSKDENDLREYLFDQLQLLERKKRIDNKLAQMENTINQLSHDKLELRKCNTIVSRALNKKVVDYYNIDKKMKNLNSEIEKVVNSIHYHEYMGDCYKEELNKIKENNI